ncbi:protein phosphatase 1 regulatory subunit 1C isoform X1 [Aotus nancymaae]|uniref:protein phosphatase 1 regulatory subunit 1C isoform X1 n=2 Tax=Aotus nancymaae TaxID=37293 RepID=UPI0030FECA7C
MSMQLLLGQWVFLPEGNYSTSSRYRIIQVPQKSFLYSLPVNRPLEEIRKRRPTPASLVILNDHNPPEIDDKRVPNTQGESQNASPKQRKQSVYTPPTMKGAKHLKGQNESAFPEEDEGTSEREEQRDH